MTQDDPPYRHVDEIARLNGLLDMAREALERAHTRLLWIAENNLDGKFYLQNRAGIYADEVRSALASITVDKPPET